jgi:hypothetical protein
MTGARCLSTSTAARGQVALQISCVQDVPDVLISLLVNVGLHVSAHSQVTVTDLKSVLISITGRVALSYIKQ